MVTTDDTTTAAGGCACGRVRYRVTGALRPVTDCHCEPCRRWTGHHMAATNSSPANLHIESGETLRWWDATPSVQYGFCSECGSSLFWRAADKPDGVAITAGSLDHPSGLTTDRAIFMDEHGDYHAPDPTLEQLPRDS